MNKNKESESEERSGTKHMHEKVEKAKFAGALFKTMQSRKTKQTVTNNTEEEEFANKEEMLDEIRRLRGELVETEKRLGETHCDTGCGKCLQWETEAKRLKKEVSTAFLDLEQSQSEAMSLKKELESRRDSQDEVQKLRLQLRTALSGASSSQDDTSAKQVEKLRKKVKQLDEECNKLAEELDTQDATIAELKKEKESLQKTVDEAGSSQADTRQDKEISKLKLQLTELEEAKQGIEQKLKDERVKLKELEKTLKKNFEVEKQNLLKEIKEYEQSSRNKDREIEKFKRDLEKASKEVEQNKGAALLDDKTKEELKKVKKIKKELDELNDICNDLKNKNKNLESDKSKLEATVKKYEKDASLKKDDSKNAKKMEKELRELEQRCTQLEEENSELEIAKFNLHESEKTYQKEANALKKTLAEKLEDDNANQISSAKLNNLEEKIKLLQNENSSLKESVEDKCNVLSQCEKGRTEAREQLADALENLSQVQAKLEAATSHSPEDRELATLRKLVADLESEKVDLKHKLMNRGDGKTEEKLAEQTSENAKLLSKLACLRNENADLKRSKNELDKLRHEAQGGKEQERNLEANKKVEMSRLLEENSRNNLAYAKMKASLNSADGKIQSLEAHCKALESERDKSQETIQMMRADKEQLREHNAELRVEVTKKEHQVRNLEMQLKLLKPQSSPKQTHPPPSHQPPHQPPPAYLPRHDGAPGLTSLHFPQTSTLTTVPNLRLSGPSSYISESDTKFFYEKEMQYLKQIGEILNERAILEAEVANLKPELRAQQIELQSLKKGRKEEENHARLCEECKEVPRMKSYISHLQDEIAKTSLENKELKMKNADIKITRKAREDKNGPSSKDHLDRMGKEMNFIKRELSELRRSNQNAIVPIDKEPPTGPITVTTEPVEEKEDQLSRKLKEEMKILVDERTNIELTKPTELAQVNGTESYIHSYDLDSMAPNLFTYLDQQKTYEQSTREKMRLIEARIAQKEKALEQLDEEFKQQNKSPRSTTLQVPPRCSTLQKFEFNF